MMYFLYTMHLFLQTNNYMYEPLPIIASQKINPKEKYLLLPQTQATLIPQKRKSAKPFPSKSQSRSSRCIIPFYLSLSPKPHQETYLSSPLQTANNSTGTERQTRP